MNALILEGRSHYRQVTDADRARSTIDEDTFILNRLPALCPESAPLVAAVAEAEGLIARRDVQGGLRLLMTSAQREPRFVRTWLTLAEGFLKIGSVQGARDAWEKALAIDPRCREARVAVTEVAMARREKSVVQRHLDALLRYVPTDELVPKLQDWMARA